MNEVIEDAPKDAWIITTLATSSVYVSVRMTRLQDMLWAIWKRYEYMLTIHT